MMDRDSSDVNRMDELRICEHGWRFHSVRNVRVVSIVSAGTRVPENGHEPDSGPE